VYKLRPLVQGESAVRRMDKPVRTFVIVLITGCLGLFSTASAQQNSSFNWSITPYLWAPTTKVDLTFRDTDIGSGEISFKDLFDTLETAFMIQVEGGKGNWSGFVDLTYLETAATISRTLFTIDSNSKQTFFDAAVVYWPSGFGSQLSLFGGVRYSGLDDRYTFFGTANGTFVGERHSKNDYYDGLLGLRYRFDFSDRWALLTHGDYSFGDSEGIFILRANFAYTVGKKRQNRILFGYQYKESEFKDGDLTTSFKYNGPMAGFDFRF
jgi:hypothetical protein